MQSLECEEAFNSTLYKLLSGQAAARKSHLTSSEATSTTLAPRTSDQQTLDPEFVDATNLPEEQQLLILFSQLSSSESTQASEAGAVGSSIF